MSSVEIKFKTQSRLAMAHMHGDRLSQAAENLISEQSEPGYASTYEWVQDFGSTYTCIRVHVFEPGPGFTRVQAESSLHILKFEASIKQHPTGSIRTLEKWCGRGHPLGRLSVIELEDYTNWRLITEWYLDKRFTDIALK